MTQLNPGGTCPNCGAELVGTTNQLCLTCAPPVDVVSVYTPEQAVDDGILVDVSEWASPEKGIMRGILQDGKSYKVLMTRTLFNLVEAPNGSRTQDTRGRAHDTLWMGGIALQAALKRRDTLATNATVKLGRSRVNFWVKKDGDTITLLMPSDY